MFHLFLIYASLLNTFAAMPGDGHPLLQDGGKHSHVFIGFQNSSSEDGSIDYYSNTLLKSLEVRSGGEIELTENDMDIKSISPDGYVLIKERDWLTYRSVRLTAGAGGKIEKAYTIQGREYEFDADAQAWLSAILQDIARETGLGAEARIKRILDQKGVAEAIREIRWVNSNRAKQIYFNAILNSPKVSSLDIAKAVETVAHEISSSSRLGDLLISTAARFPEDSVLTESLIRATREISSSSKQSEVLIRIVELRQLNDDAAILMAKAVKHISSSSAQGSALENMAERVSGSDDVITAYVDAVGTVSSSSVKGEALKAIVRNKGISEDGFIKIIKSVEDISSSSVQGDVLERIAEVCPGTDRVLSAYLRAVSYISSSSEQGHSVLAMLRKKSVSASILTQTLQFANEEISSRSVRDEITERVTERLAKSGGR